MEAGKYSVFDNLIEGVQIIDFDFRYIYVNESVANQGKSTKEALLGYTMTEKYPGIENTEVYKSIQECMINRNYLNMINEFNFPDGSTGYFELRIQAIEEGVLVLSFDITEQRRAEKIISEINAQLEKQVSNRTVELIEQKTVIENQLYYLEELNTTKDKFFSIVAHDLKAPLNSLKSFSSLLIDNVGKMTKDEVIKISQNLHYSVDNVSKMADNLLTWARVQMNDFETKCEKVPVKDIICDLYEVYKDVAINKHVNLIYSADENLFVQADRDQLTFIIRNLVNNAIKYTHKGGSVKIKAHPNDNEVLISVSDNGIGISDSVKSNLLSINKGHSINGTDGEKGTGLGLMLCNEFIKLNGGTIEIQSEVAKGTTFTVRLKNWTDQT